MKKLLIFLVVVVALYCGAWFGYSSYVKTFITQNVHTAFKESGLGSVQYESVEVSGFPTRVDVTLKNTKTELNSGEIFKGLVAELERKSKKRKPKKLFKDDIDWKDTFVREGSVTISGGILSNEYNIKTDGVMRYKGAVNGEQFDVSMKGSGTDVKVVFTKSPLLIDRDNQDKKGEEYLKEMLSNIKLFQLTQGKNEIYDDNTNNLLQSSEGTHLFYRMNKDASGKGEVELKFQGKDSQITPEYEQMLSKIHNLMISEELSNNYASNDLSRRGKVNLDAHIIYQGGLSEEILKKKEGSFTLKIPKLIYYDDLSKNQVTDAEFSIVSAKRKMDFLKVKYDSRTKLDEKWYDYFIQDMDDLKQELLSADDPSEALEKFEDMPRNVQRKLRRKSADELVATIVKFIDNLEIIMPKFHDWGTIDQNVDIVYDVNGEKKLEINKIDFTTTVNGVKRGIQIKGDVISYRPAPNATMSISLLNYSSLIDDIMAYINNVRPVYEEISGEQIPFEIKEGFEQALKSVLVKLSDAPTQEGRDVNITIKADDKNPFPMIGNMMMMQAAGFAQSTLAPYLLPVMPKQGSAPDGDKQSDLYKSPTGNVLQPSNSSAQFDQDIRNLKKQKR